MAEAEMGGMSMFSAIESVLYTLTMPVIFAVALGAIWCRDFHDNLLQRLGLLVVCFGAALRVLMWFKGPDVLVLRYAFEGGVALYALGTVQKFRYFNRRTKPMRRRRTDTTGAAPCD